jgi:hypothetical protein
VDEKVTVVCSQCRREFKLKYGDRDPQTLEISYAQSCGVDAVCPHCKHEVSIL